MANEIDYMAVLTDLKAKRSTLDGAISSLEQWISFKGGDNQIDSSFGSIPDRTGGPGKIRSDAFFGMTIPDAIRACLKITKQPLGLTDLAQKLREGGLLTSAKDLTSTVSATLTRIKRTDGDLVQPTQGKWGLAEWYPGMRKEKVEANIKSKRPQKRPRRKIVKDEPKSESPKPNPRALPTKPSDEQIAEMKKLLGEGKNFGQIGKILGLPTLTVWRALK